MMASARTRVLVFVHLVVLAASFPVLGEGRRRAVAVSPSLDELAITFVDAEHAVLDAGALAHRPRTSGKGMATSRREVGIRIGSPSREARGTATLRAFLETADPRCIVRIDGIVIGATPRVIQHHAPIGIATRHRIEIEVPPDVPEGALVMTIGWEVTTN